jgi:hypothetical protein
MTINIRPCIFASLIVLCAPQAGAQTPTEQYAVCSGYSFTLSFTAPKFAPDLTESQPKKRHSRC